MYMCKVSRSGTKHDAFQGCSSGNIGRKASIHGPAAPANRYAATVIGSQRREGGCRDVSPHSAYVVAARVKGAVSR